MTFLLSLLAATSAVAADLPEDPGVAAVDTVLAENWLTGGHSVGSPVSAGWVSADGLLRVVFQPAPTFSTGFTPPTALAILYMDCATLSAPYGTGSQGADTVVTFEFGIRRDFTYDSCPETERAHAEDILGQTARGLRGGDVLRSDAGLELRREMPTGAMQAMVDALVLPDGKRWVPVMPSAAPWGRVSAYQTYARDGWTGGYDGCNGWSADYRILPSGSGARIVTQNHTSTLRGCQWPEDVEQVELSGDVSTAVEDGQLVTRSGTGTTRWLAMTESEHDAHIFEHSRRRFLSRIARQPGEVWAYAYAHDDPAPADDDTPRRGWFSSIGGGPLQGHDGCNRFDGSARVVRRDGEHSIGIGMELSGDVVATEMFCPWGEETSERVFRVFASDAQLSVRGDQLFVHQPAGTTVFARIPHPAQR